MIPCVKQVSAVHVGWLERGGEVFAISNTILQSVRNRDSFNLTSSSGALHHVVARCGVLSKRMNCQTTSTWLALTCKTYTAQIDLASKLLT